MERLRGVKCEYGYIHKQKIFQGLVLLLYIAIGIGFFLLGLFVTGTRANVFTVMGILMVLPGAKRVIALVVMLPQKSVSPERYEKIRSAVREGEILLMDYVFTSEEKIMSLDYVVIHADQVWGVKDTKKQDMAYMTEYLQKHAEGVLPGCKVRLFDSEDEFYRFYRRTVEGKEPENSEKLADCLKILAV